MSTRVTIPADLARQIEADACKLSVLIRLIDVVHEAAQGADLSRDTIETDAANGLPVLIEMAGELARRHLEAVEAAFAARPI